MFSILIAQTGTAPAPSEAILQLEEVEKEAKLKKQAGGGDDGGGGDATAAAPEIRSGADFERYWANLSRHAQAKRAHKLHVRRTLEKLELERGTNFSSFKYNFFLF